MKVTVSIKETYFWQKFTLNDDILWFKGHLFNHSVSQLIDSLKNIKTNDLCNYFSKLDGFFALVFQRRDLVIAAVDSVCSIPLFYSEIDNNYDIDSHAPSLVKKMGISEFNNNAILAVKMSGYTVNNDTIYQSLMAINPGQIIVFESTKILQKILYLKVFNLLVTVCSVKIEWMRRRRKKQKI